MMLFELLLPALFFNSQEPRPEVPRLPGLEKFLNTDNISFLYSLDSFDIAIISLYFGILFILSIYGAYRLRLVYLFWRYAKYKPVPKSQFTELPRVTVQLPLFNEMYVVDRLLKAVTELDYPRELFEIQVLDDSTDETVEIAARAVEHYKKLGFDITYLHRKNRNGFKAGALEEGLKVAKGQMIAIFDADFIPRPDCLMKMIHYFTDEKIGMVQMRWSHINGDYSLLTRIQAMLLDGHFVIEQMARNRSGGFFNFNGTAGMWRREAIEYSGGWQHDTLTEDTDLSYRAQLMGWKFIYLLDDDVPAEVPVEINAFKAQQRRWAKGVIQVGIKLLGRIIRNPHLPRHIKIELFFRLTSNIASPLMIVLALLHLPVLIVRYNQGFFHLLIFDTPILIFSSISVLAFYGSAQRYLYPDSWKKRIKYLPLVMAMGIGLTFSNARAVLEAVLGIKSSFVRTPKYKVESTRDNWLKQAMKYKRRSGLIPVLEVLSAFYFAFTIYYALTRSIFGTVPFLMIFLFGYGYTGAMSMFQSAWQRFAKANKN
jgi:cellulose synthase/poly-beta-1,6-N-acetylglucosamine synthase-like glycosyltransferase